MATLITVTHDGTVYRWSPTASFLAAWAAADAHRHVPDDMIELPDWINRTQLDRGALETLITRGVLTRRPPGEARPPKPGTIASQQVMDHPYTGQRRLGASCQYIHPDDQTMCARAEGDHGEIPAVQPRPAPRCTHGGDCTVHPEVRGLHDFTPTASEALGRVLAAVQIRHKFDEDDVRQIAAAMGVELER